MIAQMPPNVPSARHVVVGQRPPPWAEDLSDTGYIARAVARTADHLIYVPEHASFYVWHPFSDDAGRWERDTQEAGAMQHTLIVSDALKGEAEMADGENREKLLKAASTCRSWSKRKIICEGMRVDPKLVIPAIYLDENPLHLVVRNGTLDLGAGQLTRSRPGHYNTRCAAVDYDEDARSRRLDEFFDLFIPDVEERRHILRVAAASLRGGNPNRAFVILIGRTTTGKSVLVKLLMATLGDYATTFNRSVFRGNMEDKPRPDILDVLTARIIFGMEASDTWQLHGDEIKKMTSDHIKARGMRENLFVERLPDFTPWIVANTAPRVTGADSAVKRRLRVLAMDRQISVEQDDPTIGEDLVRDPEAQRALLALLAGELRETSGYMPGPREVPMRFARRTLEVFADLSDVGQFLADLREVDELIEVDPATWPGDRHDFVSMKTLHEMYVTWVRQDSRARQHLTIRRLNRELRDLGWTSATIGAHKRWEGKIVKGTTAWAFRMSELL